MDLVDWVGQDPVLLFLGFPGPGGEPLVAAGPVDVHKLAEPLYLAGGPVVVNELEAPGHQFASPANCRLAEDVLPGGERAPTGLEFRHPRLQPMDPPVRISGRDRYLLGEAAQPAAVTPRRS
ncbi:MULTISPECIES: hypothetical protein [unclassified Streptomyces]|uniref:hypothetical protein n=1 Tax=Streptomyces sp. NPDC127532 TaxID=3345399 RepID=UPI003639C613